MERSKSVASVLQIPLGSSEDAIDNTPQHDSTSSKLSRPTPLDFANFLPWLCSEWQSAQIVVVASVVQEEYVSVHPRSNLSKASRASLKSKSSRKVEVPKINEEINSKLSKTSFTEVPLLITATFDSKSHLVEVSITDRDININRKTIQAISVCIPFHCLLTRLTLRWTELDNILIYEIAKFLPNSYLTDIILDDTRGRPNYEMLLSKASSLRYLSLNRCLIDDDQCKKIAANIAWGSAGVTLNVLDLGSNFITDVGALAIAESLRRNRNLLHLNLSGNMVTNDGAIPLLSNLMKFPLRQDELMETKKRKIKYIQKKLKIYDICYNELVLRRRDEDTRIRIRGQKIDFNISNKKQKAKKTMSPEEDREYNHSDEATRLTLERVGEFIDPFDNRSTILENGRVYCTGNLVLCSLNLAYNNLNSDSLQKIYEVLKYQHDMMASEGLKRIVFFGNQLPVDSELYSDIANYLLSKVNVAFHKNYPKKEKSTHKLKKMSVMKML